MQLRLALALVLLLAKSHDAAAINENVLCLQNQLAASGVDPGPADGLIGIRTYRALRCFSRERGVGAGDDRLAPGSALMWCPRLGRTVDPQDLTDLIAHEVLHLVVRQILPLPHGTLPEAERTAQQGPLWLHEGHAMIFADSVARNISPDEDRRRLLRLYRNRPLPDLRDLETRAALADRIGDVHRAGAIAVSLLVERHGDAAMGRLYEAMADGQPFAQAFAQIFDQPVEAFYDSHAAMARPRASPDHPAPAPDAVRCVQAQLNALGHGAGAVDGQPGPRTLAAVDRLVVATSAAELRGQLWSALPGAIPETLQAFLVEGCERPGGRGMGHSRGHGGAVSR